MKLTRHAGEQRREIGTAYQDDSTARGMSPAFLSASTEPRQRRLREVLPPKLAPLLQPLSLPPEQEARLIDELIEWSDLLLDYCEKYGHECKQWS